MARPRRVTIVLDDEAGAVLDKLASDRRASRSRAVRDALLLAERLQSELHGISVRLERIEAALVSGVAPRTLQVSDHTRPDAATETVTNIAAWEPGADR